MAETWLKNGAPVDPLHEMRRAGVAVGRKWLDRPDVAERLQAVAGVTWGEYTPPAPEPEPSLVDQLVAALDDAETRERLAGALDPEGARG